MTPKNTKFYPDGVVTDYGPDEKEKGYKQFKSGQAETYAVGLRAVAYGGINITMWYPSAVDRKPIDT